MAQKEVAFKIIVDTEQVFPEIDNIKKEIEKLKAANEKMSEEIKNGFKAAEKSTKSLGTSIGGLLKSLGLVGLAMAVFEFMRDIVSKNQKVMDALNTATTALEIILYKLFDALEPIGSAMKAAFEDPKQAVADLWEAIKQNLLNRLEGVVMQFKALGTIIKSAIDLDWDGVTQGAKDFAEGVVQMGTGLDAVQRAAALDGFKDFVDEVSRGTKEALNQAAALTALRNELTLLEAGQKKVQLSYQREAELQRQRRDDIRLTLEDRIEANEELSRILQEQLEEEEKIAKKRLELAIRERDELGANTERKAAVLIAEGELADLRERIVGQESEQLTNQAALEQELYDLRQELSLALLEDREKEEAELEAHYDRLKDMAFTAGEDVFEVEEARERALADMRQKFRDEDIEAEKKAAQEKAANEEKIYQSRVAAASAVSGALSAIGDLMVQQGQENTAAAKTLAIAQIAIDTAAAISGAIKTATQGSATPWDMIAGIAAGVAAVISAVAQATQIINGVTVGGGTATTPSYSSVTAASAPSFTPVTTNTTELGNTETAELAPIQAFVVETQLTDTQFNIQQIEGQATFGADLGG